MPLGALAAVLDRIDWPAEDNRIPREVFTDPDLYRLEMERVFRGPVWFVVGHEAELPRPGDFKTTLLGETPILVTRDLEGRVRGLVNTCAHRSNLVETAPAGNARAFTCIYHCWTYNLDGSLSSCSLPEDYPPEFRKEEYGLQPVRLASHAGVIFATLSPGAPPPLDYLGELARVLEITFPRPARYLGSQRFLVQANWKLYAENFYDGYHSTILHRTLNIMKVRTSGGGYLDPGANPYHAMSQIFSRDPSDEIRQTFRDTSPFEVHTKPRGEDGTYPSWLVNVFPVSSVNDQYDMKAIRRAIPRGVDRTEVHMDYFALEGEPEETVRRRVRAGSNLFGPAGYVNMEDIVVFERMQRAAAARGAHTILKGTVKQNPPYRKADEAHMRAFYQGYRRLVGI